MEINDSHLPWIVSIAFNWHDSSVAVSHGPHVKLVLEAERIFRIKKLRCDKKQMEELISLALKETGITLDDVGIWCGTGFGNEFTKNEMGLVEDVHHHGTDILGRKVNTRFVNHHRSHAAMYFSSPFDRAVIISCDGGGDDEDHVPFLGDGLTLQRLEPTETINRFSSIFYDRASFYLYGQYRQEGKFMGLANWGEIDEQLKNTLVDKVDFICNSSEEDGLDFFRKIYPVSYDPKDRRARNFTATVQRVFEECRLLTAREYRHISPNLVLVGGAALNVVANSVIADEAGYDDIFVPPCCDDTGQALGALLDTIVAELGMRPQIDYPFLGREEEIRSSNAEFNDIPEIARQLAEGKIIAWHCGRGEIGPRALGHRSLLASPATLDMKVKISERVKQRESYRPVAPIILSEHAEEWFEIKTPSPFMSFSVPATAKCRAEAPAVVHIDGSARVQTVPAGGDAAIRDLLSEFYAQTGIPLLINTSLNGPDMPICDKVSDTIGWLSKLDRKNNDGLSLAVNGRLYDFNYLDKGV